MAITLNGTTGISSPGGDTSTSLATTNLSYTGTLTGGTGVIAIGTNQIYKDASGNVGIGTSSPGAASGYTTLDVSNATNGARIRCLVGSTAYGGMYTNGTTDFRIGSLAAVPLNIITGSNTIATFDTSGNLGLSVTPNSGWISNGAIENQGGSIWSNGPTVNYYLQNAYFGSGSLWRYRSNNPAAVYYQYHGSHYWSTAPSGTAGNEISFGDPKMTLTASGDLLVGTPSPLGSGEKIAAVGAGVRIFSVQNNTNTSGYNGIGVQLGGSNCNNTSTYHFTGSTPGINQWYLYGNGTSSFTSDERKKKNIETTRNGYLEDLCKLRVVKYNWWTDDDGTPKELGLIAQEVEQIFPGLITNAIHPDVDGETYKVMKGSVIPFMLLKAIQELTTRLEALEAQ